MKFKALDVKEVKLVMFEKTMMGDSKMEKDKDNKTIFVKTGTETEHTTYTFRDSFGEKLVLLSKNNDYRKLEGEFVNVTLDVVFNDFSKKNKVSLVSIEKSAK